MSISVPLTQTQTPPPEPSTSSKILGGILGVAIGMPIKYGIGYGVGKWIGKIPPVNQATLFALSVPIRPLTSYGISTALGCKKTETPWRNITAMFATSIATNALAAVACNYLGYEIDTTTLLHKNIIGLAHGVAFMSFFRYAYQLDNNDDQVVENKEASEPHESTPLDPSRVRPITGSPELKAHNIQQEVLVQKELKVA